MSRPKPLNAWRPEADAVALAVLGKLAEELSEGVSATARCIIQGIDEVEPVTGKPNRQWLQEELADSLATIWIAVDHFDLNKAAILRRAEKKKDHLARWHALLRGRLFGKTGVVIVDEPAE